MKSVAAESRKLSVSFVPTKLVNTVQFTRFDETWIVPLIPADKSSLKLNPLLAMGSVEAKLSCNLNVLLDVTLTVLVAEVFPPKSTAYALTVFVPDNNGNVADQFVHALVVIAGFQAPPFN